MAKRTFLLVVALLMSLVVALPAWAADGDLDPSFGGDAIDTAMGNLRRLKQADIEWRAGVVH